ncbi:hypothetical protein [Arsenophonus nasoniae]|uniref:hypothetical protein n=1 Tax=Arsenophonus nasoniae TaxID=638 RepID=UPI0024694264|nr:hypothetical protein [Arsenophonus nasoniae]
MPNYFNQVISFFNEIHNQILKDAKLKQQKLPEIKSFKNNLGANFQLHRLIILTN